MFKKKKAKSRPYSKRKILAVLSAVVILVLIFVLVQLKHNETKSPDFILETTPTFTDKKLYGLEFEKTSKNESVFTLYKTYSDDKELKTAGWDVEVESISYEKIRTTEVDNYVMVVKIHESFRSTDALIDNKKNVGRRLRILQKLPSGSFTVKVITTGIHEERTFGNQTITGLPDKAKTLFFEIP